MTHFAKQHQTKNYYSAVWTPVKDLQNKHVTTQALFSTPRMNVQPSQLTNNPLFKAVQFREFTYQEGTGNRRRCNLACTGR